MKLAILGHSSFALRFALFFDRLEASVTWFLGDRHLDSLFTLGYPAWDDETSTEGLEKLKSLGHKLDFLNTNFSWESWEQNYFRPLLNDLASRQSIKPFKVNSVAKRFLSFHERIPQRSRFFDLFRLVYELNPEEFIQEQKELNPETYEKLTEEFMRSLNASLEMYEDFDVVLDLRRYKAPNSMSPTGFSMGEKKIKSEKIHHDLESLFQLPDPKTREIAIIGSTEFSAEILFRLKNWLQDQRNTLFIISHEEDPFEKLLNHCQIAPKEHLNQLIEQMDTEFREDQNAYIKNVREWEELDDFVKVKKPKPPMPIPRLVFFSAHNVSAVDQLIDKKRLFLTLEKPEWREGLKQKENNQLDLKTIGVDEIYVTMGMDQEEIVRLPQDEKGYFSSTSKASIFLDGKLRNENEFQKITIEILKLFSPHSAS
jgi:hypothetical protein